MKVLVIGGAGYIGSHVVYDLLKEGHTVVVMDNLSTGDINFVPTTVTFYKGDIKNSQDLDKVFSNEKGIDLVMHFAAKLIVPESMVQPSEYYHNNVEGVRLMLEAMKKHKIQNLVFSSTAAVYGNPINEICKETDPTVPINPYGDSKLAAEKLIEYFSKAHEINYCIFRYFNVAGADSSLEIGLNKQNLTHLIPVTIQTMMGIRNKMMVFGDDYNTKDGTCIRDYIHVNDLARAHVLGAEYIISKSTSLLLNLGSNEGYTVMEIINEVEKHGKVNYEIGKRREGDPAKIIASNQKAKDLLNWEPKYNLKDIIKSDLDYRKNLNK